MIKHTPSLTLTLLAVTLMPATETWAQRRPPPSQLAARRDGRRQVGRPAARAAKPIQGALTGPWARAGRARPRRVRPRVRDKTILAGPVWRRDRRAVALLRRGPVGLTVEVRTASSPYPLVRHVPRTFAGKPRLFWIGPRRVGLGPSPLMPRVVLSWEPVVVSQ